MNDTRKRMYRCHGCWQMFEWRDIAEEGSRAGRYYLCRHCVAKRDAHTKEER
jgi:DNA-directed RNA polymerase subunit RPC12/RpoP